MAIYARLAPQDVTVYSAGNIYIADTDNHRIRKVDSVTKKISTVAGTGTAGFSGDNECAFTTVLNQPYGVAVDNVGNIYIADSGNHRIRKVDGATNIIRTMAGTGASGFSGNGGAATAAHLNAPFGVALDNVGNILIADSSNHTIRKVTITPPTISMLIPADGETTVGINDNLVITFNEDVVVGIGNIIIKKASDNSVVETINVAGGAVTASGSAVTIDPSVTFANTTTYYVQIDTTVFDDVEGNSFAGIGDTTSWNFTTVNPLTGTANITGNVIFGETLTALLDGGNNTRTLLYQWTKDSANITVNANNETYALVQNDIGKQIAVIISSSDPVGTITSNLTSSVEKLDSLITTVLEPLLLENTHNSITLTTQLGYEYRLDNNPWQDSNVFTGLTPETLHPFTQRVKETAIHKASVTSSSIHFGTIKAPLPLMGTASLTGNAIFGETLTASLTGDNNTGTVLYQWTRGGTDISGATSSTYTLIQDDIGALLAVKISSTVETGTITSTPTSPVEKANSVPTTAITPILSNKTHNSVTLTTVVGYEYTVVTDNTNVTTGTWQDSNKFTGLNANTPYDFYQRVKETATYKVSSVSSKLDVTTNSRPSGGTPAGGGTSGVSPSDKDQSEDLPEKPTKHIVYLALEQGEVHEEGQLIGTVEITEPNSGGEYLQDIPADYFKEERKLIKIKTPVATVTLPNIMFAEVPTGKIEISICDLPKDELPEKTREQIGDKPVISVNILVDGEKVKWSNDNVEVEVTIPYTPTDEELKNPNALNKIIAVYIDDDGNIIPLTFSSYDPERGAVILRVNHFSHYGVQYVDKDFVDLGKYTWAKGAIATLAARGVINGVSEKEFAPQKDITRADFVVLISRFLELDEEFAENFSDVKEGAYYYNAVGIAKNMEIVTGMGNNEFKPLQPISRQDMMVIITRALKITGQNSKLTYSSGKKLSDFNDKGEVASYARESVEFLI
ncbi:MAG: S-layer homology domain-containing protein [Clostridiales bacterium]|nr:S-layer homology domain-containing protein [Clostridiales bacterium]